VSFSNIKEILKIKDNFSNLSSKKSKEIHKKINKPRKKKLRLYMTIKGYFKRQVLVLMSTSNILIIMASSGKHIANINKALKSSLNPISISLSLISRI